MHNNTFFAQSLIMFERARYSNYDEWTKTSQLVVKMCLRLRKTRTISLWHIQDACKICFLSGPTGEKCITKGQRVGGTDENVYIFDVSVVKNSRQKYQ